jgi:hypothetical protein
MNVAQLTKELSALFETRSFPSRSGLHILLLQAVTSVSRFISPDTYCRTWFSAICFNIIKYFCSPIFPPAKENSRTVFFCVTDRVCGADTSHKVCGADTSHKVCLKF